MRLSKKVANLLFGKYDSLGSGNHLRETLTYPNFESDFFDKKFTWRGDTGIILTIIEKIDKLEKEINELKIKKIKK